MSEIDDLRRTTNENAIAIARFDLRLKALEDEHVDRKKLVAQIRTLIVATIIGAVFTASTVIDILRAWLKNLSQ